MDDVASFICYLLGPVRSSTLTPQLIRENAFLRRRTTWSLVTAGSYIRPLFSST